MPDEPLLSLIHLIASGDEGAATRSLKAQPELAAGALARGASRSESTEFFLTAIAHHIYAGDTALHVAAAAYAVGLVTELAASGAVIDAVNRRGARPLHYAVDGGPNAAFWNPDAQCRTVAALLSRGADPDAPDRNGTPPLLRAVRNRCTPAVEALLAGGADPTATNGKGSTALQLARVTSGRGGTGTDAAKREQAAIIRVLEAATRV